MVLIVAACGASSPAPTPPKVVAPSDLEPQWGRVCYRGTARDTAGNTRELMIAHVVDPATAMVTQVWVVTDEKLAAVPPRWQGRRTIQFVMGAERTFEVHENTGSTETRHGRGSSQGPTWWWSAWAYRIAIASPSLLGGAATRSVAESIDDLDPTPRALVRATAHIDHYEQHTAIPSLGYAETVTAKWMSCVDFTHDP